MRWAIGPWRWVSDEFSGCYEGPEGTQCAIDFRSLPEQGAAGNDMSGVGLFLVRGPVTSEWEQLGQGNWHDLKANQRMCDLFPKRARKKLDADDLIGLIRQSLTQGDPTGQEFCKPLMPGALGTLEVTIAKQRHCERFQWGKSKESNIVRDVIRADMDELIERCGREADEKKRHHHRRVLDMLCERHGIDDWKQFVKPNRVKDIEGRLPHETTITDAFTRADQTGLGTSAAGWSWGVVVTGIDIFSNRGRVAVVNNARSRAETDLSSADHYSQTRVIQSFASNRQMAALARYNVGADTCYAAFTSGLSTASVVLQRVVGGTATTITSFDRGTTILNRVVKINVSGSNLEAYEDGVLFGGTTDTNITGNLRCGIGKTGGPGTQTNEFDDFEAGDLGGGGILFTQLERGLRGVKRGVYTDMRG